MPNVFWTWLLTPLPTFTDWPTGLFEHIYYVWIQYFHWFTQYLRDFVFDRWLTSNVIDQSLLIFFFLLFLSFVCAFIFFSPKK